MFSSMKKIRGPTIANSRRSNRSFCLDIGDAVELKIFKESEIKKMDSPNKGEELPLPPLLRTVRDTFASYGSSNLQPGYRATVGKEIQLGLRFRDQGSCSIYPAEEIIPVQEWICIKSDLWMSPYFGV